MEKKVSDPTEMVRFFPPPPADKMTKSASALELQVGNEVSVFVMCFGFTHTDGSPGKSYSVFAARTWHDVNSEGNLGQLIAFHQRTRKYKHAPCSSRVHRLWSGIDLGLDHFVQLTTNPVHSGLRDHE